MITRHKFKGLLADIKVVWVDGMDGLLYPLKIPKEYKDTIKYSQKDLRQLVWALKNRNSRKPLEEDGFEFNEEINKAISWSKNSSSRYYTGLPLNKGCEKGEQDSNPWNPANWNSNGLLTKQWCEEHNW